MQAERWARVKDIFAAALERTPAERDAFIVRECAGDEALFAEVSSLLVAHDTAGDFIDAPAAEVANVVAAKAPKDWIGRRLGPYRIVAEAGRGGMSQVFKAARDDEQYDKQVAIKLLKPGLDTESVLRRFKAERQILAQLSHPNIAHLLDGGATEDGEPYLVMEYIEGKPIDVYCDEAKLSINERLDLFRELCSAVHYVHQHLMVHGDIKGGNVLVTSQGTVKLLDFGIAKLLSGDSETPRTESRATTFMALTPEYASPEQVCGEPMTTASDVYSSGVLLYRLLSGELPYRTAGSSSWTLAKAICEADVMPPSATAQRAGGNHARFAKTLHGDLDNIILKALKKAPEERYTSAEHLAEDLRRYLRGFPVLAHADTTGYRVRKFAQRHKSATVAAALFVIALTTGIVTTTWQALEAKRARERAERHFNAVRELSAVYLADVYSAVAKLPGGTAARKLLVENSIKYLASLEHESRDSPELQRDLAMAYERLGDVQGDFNSAAVGDTKGAIESYQRSLQIRRELVAQNPSLEAKRELVRAALNLSEFIGGLSDTEQALSLAQEAVRAADDILKNPQATRSDRELAAAAYMTWGWELGILGNMDASLASLGKAREIFESIAAEHPGDAEAQRDLVILSGRTGHVYLDKPTPEPEKALVHYQDSLRLIQPLITAAPDDAALQRMLAFIRGTIGGIYNDLRNPRAALPYHHQALETLERLQAADEADRLAPVTVVYMLDYRGESYLQLGDLTKAAEDLNRANKMLGETSAELTEVAGIQLLPGTVNSHLAQLEIAFARRASTKQQREQHAIKAREWSSKAHAALEPHVDDPVEGWRAKQELHELEAAMQALPDAPK